jgi:hypothetical protein
MLRSDWPSESALGLLASLANSFASIGEGGAIELPLTRFGIIRYCSFHLRRRRRLKADAAS